uniref:Uncharacterized protein n=1 Tax=Oryza rufipogon TaxID=4529 RepID=A0A0E0NYL1_ORYRU
MAEAESTEADEQGRGGEGGDREAGDLLYSSSLPSLSSLSTGKRNKTGRAERDVRGEGKGGISSLLCICCLRATVVIERSSGDGVKGMETGELDRGRGGEADRIGRGGRCSNWLILLPSRSRKPSEFAWVHASKIDQEFFCWIWVSLHVIYVRPGRRMNQASPGKSEEQPEETEEMEGGNKADDAIQKASEQEADMGRGRRSRRPPSVRVVGPEWAK